jgi:hypothetical protein
MSEIPMDSEIDFWAECTTGVFDVGETAFTNYSGSDEAPASLPTTNNNVELALPSSLCSPNQNLDFMSFDASTDLISDFGYLASLDFYDIGLPIMC